jgi:protein-S-isoprenylcysteine O-methyltransferase Ste14
MILRLIIQSTVWYAIMGALMFGAAGTLAWPAAWIYLAEMSVLGLAAGIALQRHDPGLVKERLGSIVQRDQPGADKVLVGLLVLLILAWLVLIGLDAVRFAWSAVPLPAQVAGAIAVALSLAVGYRTMRENSFAAPVVKIQRERGHAVISTGPYAIVRHPLYSGALFFFAGTPLLLGSWWGLATAPLLAGILVLRIFIEEQALRAGLPGYAEYAARVRWRLVPRLW